MDKSKNSNQMFCNIFVTLSSTYLGLDISSSSLFSFAVGKESIASWSVIGLFAAAGSCSAGEATPVVAGASDWAPCSAVPPTTNPPAAGGPGGPGTCPSSPSSLPTVMAQQIWPPESLQEKSAHPLYMTEAVAANATPVRRAKPEKIDELVLGEKNMLRGKFRGGVNGLQGTKPPSPSSSFAPTAVLWPGGLCCHLAERNIMLHHGQHSALHRASTKSCSIPREVVQI